MRLIVFDCDGTLVDSQHLIVAALGEAFAARALTPPGPAAVRRIIGLSLEAAIGRLAPDLAEPEIAALGAAYRQAYAGVRAQAGRHEPLFPGAEATLRGLARRPDTLLGIATGKSRRGVQRLLEHYDLTRCFATVRTADDAPSKPHPAMLEQAIAETGVRADGTVMIGDTSFDMAMARAANVTALGVTWGYHGPAELRRAGAHRLADDFAALAHACDEIASPKDAA